MPKKFNKKHRSRSQKGRIRHQKREQQTRRLLATVEKNRKGFGFLIFDDSQFEDVFLSPPKAKRYFPGDRVRVMTGSQGQILEVEILEHRIHEIVGKFYPYSERSGGWVVYEQKNVREEVHTPKTPPWAKSGDWVRARISFPDKGPYSAIAELEESYGQELIAKADLPLIAGEHGLTEKHSHAAVLEAKSLKLDLDSALRNRKDLRHIPFITIDGEDARDFDDAVYVERIENGYILWVAIADVSHYVKKGTALDREAFDRGTSVYFPEKAFHMLPKELSENLCSLKPHEPRLTIVAKINLNKEGHRTSTEVYEAIIESKRRATYTEIESEKKDFPVHFELYEKLKKLKTHRGALDFDLPEAKAVVDETGDPVAIEHRIRFDSHRLIEEFMIAANEAVTAWVQKLGWPFLYRIHEEPSMEALENFFKFLKGFGIQEKLKIGKSDPKSISKILDHLKGHQAESLMRTTLLRAMKQAVYSATPEIHFGLASPGYTHFTSPIRRYPDLVVHRILHEIVKYGKQKKEYKEAQKELEEIAQHCSYRERLAADAERAALKLKQVRFMQKHLGEDFEGIVNGLTDKGIYVQVANPFVEGMITKDSITQDQFDFIEHQMLYIGRKSKRVIKMGDVLPVQAVRANLERRIIDFMLLK